MKVLVIKTSSMGDVLHTLPALTDAQKALPNIEFHWVVEKAFAEIPAWHPAVTRVIPIAFRQLRKRKLGLLFSKPWRAFKRELKAEKYDLIIDAQGLLKSVFLSFGARGPRAGYNRHSIREAMASWFYQHKVAVSKNLHAIERIRELFAKALDYTYDANTINYGLNTTLVPRPTLDLPQQYYLFIPNTTWETKLWPVTYWQQLIASLPEQNILLPGGYASEQAMVQKIIGAANNAQMLTSTTLTQIMQIMAHCTAIVSVDTGLSHLAAALDKPSVVLYGPTDPEQIGTRGAKQIHLQAQFDCAPCRKKQCHYQGPAKVEPACFQTLPPALVASKLKQLLEQ
jgi:heptosyltransferase-1